MQDENLDFSDVYLDAARKGSISDARYYWRCIAHAVREGNLTVQQKKILAEVLEAVADQKDPYEALLLKTIGRPKNQNTERDLAVFEYCETCRETDGNSLDEAAQASRENVQSKREQNKSDLPSISPRLLNSIKKMWINSWSIFIVQSRE